MDMMLFTNIVLIVLCIFNVAGVVAQLETQAGVF